MFNSRRSPVICMNGCAASSQPLASEVGVSILKQGGNAADACVAMAAVLNVVEPAATGIGGDVFCLYYDAATKEIHGLNASGRSPNHLTLEHLNKLGFNENNSPPYTHGLNVTVPGAAAGWIDCHEEYGNGKLSLQTILQPAIDLAENGFPVAGPVTSYLWKNGADRLIHENNPHGTDLLIEDEDGKFRAPITGEIFKNQKLANVFKDVAINGKSAFYEGWIAEAIVNSVNKAGGVMGLEDLQNHSNTFVDPVSMQYKDACVWELPPNGQGFVALEILNILKNFDISKMVHNSYEYLHLLIEATKISFADALTYCADPLHDNIYAKVLKKSYGKLRASEIKMESASKIYKPGDFTKMGHDTVYFTVVDNEGNACSFINSTFTGFGSGIVPKNCGFTLQNRGYGFSLTPGHANVVAPNKRPYHTIIPAMVTDTRNGELLMTFGVMGGFMQPQGHVQVLLNMIEFGMNPQEALDSSRYFYGDSYNGSFGQLNIEEGISEKVLEKLKKAGHLNVNGPVCGLNRTVFGKGQVIALQKFWDKDYWQGLIPPQNQRVLWAGSEPRSDGFAIGY